MGTEKTATLKRIRDVGLIAVLRGPSEDATIRAVEALVAGGVRSIERELVAAVDKARTGGAR